MLVRRLLHLQTLHLKLPQVLCCRLHQQASQRTRSSMLLSRIAGDMLAARRGAHVHASCCFIGHSMQATNRSSHACAALHSHWHAPTASLRHASTGAVAGQPLQQKLAVNPRRRRVTPLEIAAAIASKDLAIGHTGLEGEGDEVEDMELDPFAAPGSQTDSTSTGKKKRRMGVLQAVPVVAPANEQLSSALKRAAKVAYSAAIKNEAEKERNRAARQMDTLMKELSVPLSKYVAGFPNPDKLHPFDAALLQLTVSTPMYKGVLAKVDALRKSIQETGKALANRAANAPNKATAAAVAVEGVEALERVFRNGARTVDDLKEVAKKLRSLPVVDVGLPTLALVGAPNVGKSSLVKVLSSGTPEVCNYPFTTRSIKMGHFYLDSRKHQVTDTPGLLARPDDERNKMELLTLAALSCLPTSVLFVIDLTEECGTSVGDQWRIRQEVRQRYPEKAWVDVLSKGDLVQPILDAGAALRAKLQAEGSQQQGSTTGAADAAGDTVPTISSAEEIVARLPHALCVSSVTSAGIKELQKGIVGMFQEQARAAAALAAQAEPVAVGTDGAAAPVGAGTGSSGSGAPPASGPVFIGPQF